MLDNLVKEVELSLSDDLIVTTGSSMETFFNVSSIPRIVFAAVGAHEPFSSSATVRF